MFQILTPWDMLINIILYAPEIQVQWGVLYFCFKALNEVKGAQDGLYKNEN